MIPLLRADRIVLHKEKPILQEVSFELAAGEILTLLGPSGSGKSTLLRCLNRLESIDGGTVFLRGRDIRTLPVTELRRRVGMVFQTPALLPATVEENIGLGPRLRKETLPRSEADILLDRVGLGREYRTRKVETLSVGEQQRVALAQVLANGPEVLLMDEPTSALDPTAVLRIEQLVHTLHRELETGILWVTHDIEQAARFNTDTLVMVAGTLLARGNIRDLMRRADNETVEKFFQGKLEPESEIFREGTQDGQ